MAITNPGNATGAGTAATTSDTITIPAGVQANDIMVVAVTNRDATTDPTVVDNEGAGSWQKIANQNAQTNGAGTLWWKRATANSASKTVTCSGATGSISCGLSYFRGASLATATAGVFGTAVGEANASGNEVQAGITTGRDASWVIHAVFVTSNDTLNPGNRTATSPTSIAELWEDVSSGGSDCSCSLAAAEKASAGATGNISWSMTDGTTASIAVELRAAPTPIVMTSSAFNVTGTATPLLYKRKFVLDSSSLTLTGTDQILRYGRFISMGSAAFAVTADILGVLATRKLTLDSKSFALTGNDATLSYFSPKLLLAEGASFDLTPSDVTLSYTEIVYPGAVRYTVNSGLVGYRHIIKRRVRPTAPPFIRITST